MVAQELFHLFLVPQFNMLEVAAAVFITIVVALLLE
jgi:hypothetical protein